MFADILFPWPESCCIELTLHFTLNWAFHGFFSRENLAQGKLFVGIVVVITINKDWQPNENNRNRFILLSTIYLLQLLQWWFLSNSPIVSGKVGRKISSPPTFLPTVFATGSWGLRDLFINQKSCCEWKRFGLIDPNSGPLEQGLEKHWWFDFESIYFKVHSDQNTSSPLLLTKSYDAKNWEILKDLSSRIGCKVFGLRKRKKHYIKTWHNTTRHNFGWQKIL